jgi:hypothetical protein
VRRGRRIYRDREVNGGSPWGREGRSAAPLNELMASVSSL